MQMVIRLISLAFLVVVAAAFVFACGVAVGIVMTERAAARHARIGGAV